MSLAKAILLVSLDIIVNKYLNTFLLMIIRKPIPEDLKSPDQLYTVNQVIK